MLASSPIFASGEVDAAVRCLTAARRRCSGLPGSGLPSTPKIPDMITSSVIACMRGASAKGVPIGHVSISRSVTSAIICV